MYSPTLREPKKRGKYGRPCDRCAIRRIRCVISQDLKNCIGCLNSGEKCTRDRIRKKSGPKHGRNVASAAQIKNKVCYQGYFQGNEINDSSQQQLNVSLVGQAPYFGSKKETEGGRQTIDLPQPFDITPQGPNNSGPVSPRSFEFQPCSIGSGQTPELKVSHFPQFGPLVPQQTFRATHLMNQTRSAPLFYPLRSHQSDQEPAAIFSHHQTNQEILPNEDPENIAPAFSRIQDELQTDHSGGMNVHAPEDHEDLFAVFKTDASPYLARITLECLFSQVHVYQTWFYGYWPALSVSELLQKLQCGFESRACYNRVTLDENNAMPYALCCAVCAAITTQLSFVSAENAVISQCPISDVDFAMEAKRVRRLFNYTDNIEVETLLSSFFLYVHHTNQKGKNRQAKVYLREAITMSQILGFHEESSYNEKSPTEAHHWRKIYYMLLVTERYVCFEEGLPVILDASIKFPVLADESYPDLLVGFTELIHIFAVPSKEFFFEMNQNRHDDVGVGVEVERSLDEKKSWIFAVQEKLGVSKQIPDNVTNPHKLNIVLSKAWIRAIACHITWNNGLLRPSISTNDCFGFDFPITNAREFLLETSCLPDMAFETNGPGICVKLLEMASSLSFTVQQSRDRSAGLSVLESLFDLVNKFKNDVTLPLKIYQGVANHIARHKLKVVPRLIGTHEGGYMSQEYSAGTMGELIEDEVTQGTEDIAKEDYTSREHPPFPRDLNGSAIGSSASVSNFLNMSFSQSGNAISHES